MQFSQIDVVHYNKLCLQIWLKRCQASPWVSDYTHLVFSEGLRKTTDRVVAYLFLAPSISRGMQHSFANLVVFVREQRKLIMIAFAMW